MAILGIPPPNEGFLLVKKAVVVENGLLERLKSPRKKEKKKKGNFNWQFGLHKVKRILFEEKKRKERKGTKRR